MGIISSGFVGRKRDVDPSIPPGQYLTRDFPVLTVGPTPEVDPADWEFTIRTEDGTVHRWDWDALQALPIETIDTDIHCVTRWSKLGTTWRGVSLDTLLAEVETSAEFVLEHSYGGYTTNVPFEDITDGKAWIAFEFDGEPLEAEHGGPARFLVPHLYFWKSAKWITGITLHDQEELGFWEVNGYHAYGDPWREQRYDYDA